MTENLLDLAPRPVELDGVSVGVLDTGAADSAYFLDQLTARLEKRHFLAAVIRVVKPTDRDVYPTNLLEELARGCDVAILGVGRTVEAAQSLALDALALERMSVPCAVLMAEGLGSVVQQAVTGSGHDWQLSVVELDLAEPGQPIDVPALVEASFRDVERTLTAASTAPQPAVPRPPEPHVPAPRNGEVTCEC